MAEPLNRTTNWQQFQRGVALHRPLIGRLAVGGALLLGLALAWMMASQVQPKTVCVVVGGLLALAIFAWRPAVLVSLLAYGLFLAPPGSLLFSIRLPDYQQFLLPVGLLNALGPIIVRRRKLNLGFEEIVLPLALLASMFISSALAPGGAETFKYLAKCFVFPVAMYWLLRLEAWRLGGMEALFSRMMICYAASTALQLAERFAGTQFIFGSGQQLTGRWDLGGSHPYEVATTAVVLLPLALMQVVRLAGQRGQWVRLGVAAAPVVQLALNGERSGLLGGTLAVLVLLFYRRAHRVIVPVAVGALLLGVVGWGISYGALGRFRHQDEKMQYRGAYWTVAWSLLQSERWHKAFGLGFTGYQPVVAEALAASPDIIPDITMERPVSNRLQDVRAGFEEEGMRRAHNDLLSFPLEFGLVGSGLALAALAAVILHWRRIWQAGRRANRDAMDWAVALVASFMGWLVNLCTHNLYILRDLSMTLAVVLGLVVVLSRQYAQRRQEAGLAAGAWEATRPLPRS